MRRKTASVTMNEPLKDGRGTAPRVPRGRRDACVALACSRGDRRVPNPGAFARAYGSMMPPSTKIVMPVV
jgi:hypothetical protein